MSLFTLLLSIIVIPVLLVLLLLAYRVVCYLSVNHRFGHIHKVPHWFPLLLWMKKRDGLDQVMNWITDEDDRIVDLTHHGPNWDGAPYICVTDPDFIEEALMRYNDFPRYEASYVPLIGILGDGIYTLTGSTWKNKKSAVTPLFHKKFLEGLATHTINTCIEFTDDLAKQEGEALNGLVLFREMMMYTAINLVFGIECPVDKKHIADIWIDMLHAPEIYLMGMQFMTDIFEYFPLPWQRKIMNARKALNDIIAAQVDCTKAKLERGEPVEKCLISELIQYKDPETGKGFTLAEILPECKTFMLAGHSSAAKLMGWGCYYLGQNPDKQKKLHEEIDSVLGDRPMSEDDIERLPYTKMIVKEALRLRPVNCLDRLVTKDERIGDLFVPKGACLNLWVQGMHLNSKYWDTPHDFIPERFTTEEEAKRPSNYFLPFIGGPRACIGKKFGMQEGIVGMATIFQKLRVDSTQSPNPVPLDINTSPKDTILQFYKR